MVSLMIHTSKFKKNKPAKVLSLN